MSQAEATVGLPVAPLTPRTQLQVLPQVSAAVIQACLPIILRVELCSALSSQNLAKPEDPQKAGLWALPIG